MNIETRDSISHSSGELLCSTGGKGVLESKKLNDKLPMFVN